MRAAEPRSQGRLTGLVALLLAAACARIEAPPGGPPDRQGPRVASHRPADAVVNLGVRPEFRFEFDEWVNRASAVGEVYLSPSHEGGLELDWFYRTLIVRPRQDLPPDRTFLLELGTGIKDMGGNRMDQPFRLAFSTGAALDTFAFEGWLGGAGRADRTVIWAWPLDDFPARPLDPAPWQTRPDTAGVFRFSNLPDRPFRLFAIADPNGNGRWDGASEPAALASADPAPRPGLGPVRPTLYLGPLTVDSLGIGSVEAADRNHFFLEGRLDLPGDPGRAAQLDQLELLDSLGRRVPLLTLRKEEDGRYLMVCGNLDSLVYTLRLRNGQDSASFKGRSFSQNPFQGFERPTLLDDKRRLTWHSPRGLKAQAGAAAWVGQGRDTSQVQPQFIDALELVWGLPRTRAGDSLFVEPGLLEGLSGDTWPTERVALPLELPPTPASGALQLLFADTPPAERGWRLRVSQDGRTLADLPLASPTDLPGLPEGFVSLELYHDRDGDRAWTPGLLQPFRHAEARLPLADSLQVYPGWTREGLELDLPPLPSEEP